MPDTALRQRVADAVDALRIVDTHEHLEQEAPRLARSIDFGNWWSHYASSDLISAGMPPADLELLRDAGQPIMDRWAKLEPHWAHVRTTAYGRALLLAARELYDAPDISRDTIEGLSAKVAATNRPGWYREVLSDRAGIAVSIQCGNTEGLDRELFNPVFHSDEWVMARTRFDFERLGQRTGVPIHTLDDLCAALSAAIDAEQKAGVCGIKSALAYVRILRYDKRTREEAERVFVKGFESHGGGVDWKDAKPLQDFLFHQVIREGIRRDLTIQTHTGLQEGNGNFITNANPTHLVGLFMEYPEARFDLFHGGYPYAGELATLAKNFANVYIDMCWLHVISPTFAQRWLREWIETVPSNKISAFGGDYCFVEGAYAHSRMARQGVAATLAAMVEDGYFSEEEALDVARKILRDNPARLFGLKG